MRCDIGHDADDDHRRAQHHRTGDPDNHRADAETRSDPRRSRRGKEHSTEDQPCGARIAPGGARDDNPQADRGNEDDEHADRDTGTVRDSITAGCL
jgi:hypothetical protein